MKHAGIKKATVNRNKKNTFGSVSWDGKKATFNFEKDDRLDMTFPALIFNNDNKGKDIDDLLNIPTKKEVEIRNDYCISKTELNNQNKTTKRKSQNVIQ